MIYIVPDTNILYVDYSRIGEENAYDRFCPSDTLKKLIELVKKPCIDDVCILVPQMVISELAKQKADAYIADSKTYGDIAKRMGFPVPAFQNDYEFLESASKQATDFLENQGIPIIPVCPGKYFHEILDKALNKEAPFEGVNGKSDKGFKDAVLFYSIIEYAVSWRGTYFLLTKDGRLSGKQANNSADAKKLKSEFYDMSGGRLEIFSDLGEIERRITVEKPKRHLESLSYDYDDYNREYNDPDLVPMRVHCKFPVFRGDDAIVSRTNEEMSYLEQNFHDFCGGLDRRKYSDEDEMRFDESMTVHVCHNANGILSLLCTEVTYAGGPHGSTNISAYTYDLNAGRLIPLRDLLNIEEGMLLEMMNMCLGKDIKSGRISYFDDDVEILDSESVVYYLEDHKVHIVFNEYELAPYSEGIIDLILCTFSETDGPDFMVYFPHAVK